MNENNVPKDSNKFFPDLITFFSSHPAVAGTLIYIGVSVMGVIYTWFLYNEFQINIFDFAEANDFLLAAFKEPFAFIMSILTVISFIFLFYWYKKKSDVYIKIVVRFRYIFIFVAMFYIFIPSYFFAVNNADNIIENKKSIVNVLYKEKRKEGLFPFERELTASLIGSTNKFLFFYNHSSSHSIAIPIVNIISIKFEPLAKTAKKLVHDSKETLEKNK